MLWWGSARNGQATLPTLPLHSALGTAQALVLIRLSGKCASRRLLPFQNLAETGKARGRDSEWCDHMHLTSPWLGMPMCVAQHALLFGSAGEECRTSSSTGNTKGPVEDLV